MPMKAQDSFRRFENHVPTRKTANRLVVPEHADFNPTILFKQGFLFAMTQRAEVTFEIEETITLRSGETVLRVFCPLCQTVVEITSPQFAGAVRQTPIREVFRQVETD